MSLALLDPADAGHRLAALLPEAPDYLVVALAPSGLPAAAALAADLHAPLDVVVVRSLFPPDHRAPENATPPEIGAVGRDGVLVLDSAAMHAARLSDDEVDELATRERNEMRRRIRLYRGEDEVPSAEGRTLVLVDDGAHRPLALVAAARVARQMSPGRLIVATPVASPGARVLLDGLVDAFLSLVESVDAPVYPGFYEALTPLDDEAAAVLFAEARAR